MFNLLKSCKISCFWPESHKIEKLHGNSAALMISIFLFADIAVITMQAGSMRIGASPWEPIIQKDDESFPNTELKINCRRNSNNSQFGAYHHINKVNTYLMFTSEQQLRMV